MLSVCWFTLYLLVMLTGAYIASGLIDVSWLRAPSTAILVLFLVVVAVFLV